MLEPPLLSLGRWSPVLALLTIAACGNRADGVAGSGSNSGTSSGATGTVSGTSAGATSAASAAMASGSNSGTSSGTPGSGATSTSGTPGSGTSSGATGVTSGAGTGASDSSGATGGTGTTYCQSLPCVKTTFTNWELTGTWPQLGTPLKTMPGKLTYSKLVLDTNFYAESCAIGDYNGDGIPDVSSGRRWYAGPDFTTVNYFRGGHGALPRAGAPTELQNGVSDDWADYPWDVDGDGLVDIINIASPSYTEFLMATYQPMPQVDGTGYWYKNPGRAVSEAAGACAAGTGAGCWQAYEMSADMKLEQHGLADVDGDGKPEIFASCHTCGGGTKGYYEGDWGNPTAPWAFHIVTRTYDFPFDGTGLQHGLGFGDVNGDGKPDLLERSGAWLQPPTLPPATTPWWTTEGDGGSYSDWVPEAFSYPPFVGNSTGNEGGSHMYAVDVNGDGLTDVISTDWYYGWGLAWYEQLKPGVAPCVGLAPTATAPARECFAKHYIINTNTDAATYPLTYNGTTGAYMSGMTAVQVVDMDGDGLPDIVTGKMRFAHPYDQNDPDPDGIGYSFVFKLVRDATKPGGAYFEPHQVETGTTNNPAQPMAAPPPYMAPVGSGTAYGVGRQVAVGHLNMDGIPDICVSSKLGLVLYFGQ